MKMKRKWTPRRVMILAGEFDKTNLHSQNLSSNPLFSLAVCKDHTPSEQPLEPLVLLKPAHTHTHSHFPILYDTLSLSLSYYN